MKLERLLFIKKLFTPIAHSQMNVYLLRLTSENIAAAKNAGMHGIVFTSPRFCIAPSWALSFFKITKMYLRIISLTI